MKRKRCSGTGKPAPDDIGRMLFQNVVCPQCRGIANVDERGRIEPHTVLVIDA